MPAAPCAEAASAAHILEQRCFCPFEVCLRRQADPTLLHFLVPCSHTKTVCTATCSRNSQTPKTQTFKRHAYRPFAAHLHNHLFCDQRCVHQARTIPRSRRNCQTNQNTNKNDILCSPFRCISVFQVPIREVCCAPPTTNARRSRRDSEC